jgi:hypothetical protein
MGKFGGGAVQSKCGLVGPCILSRSHEIKGHVLAGIASKSKASKWCREAVQGTTSMCPFPVQVSLTNRYFRLSAMAALEFGVTALE